MTCDDTGAGSSPRRRAHVGFDRRRQVGERADGAGDLADRDAVARAPHARRCRAAISAYHSASFSPKVIGSACTPCVRPIIGVRRCSSARARMASASASRSFRIRSHASTICSASAVSTTSDDVRPKCRYRAAGPTCSATAVVKAMTSCCVVCLDLFDAGDVEARPRPQFPRGVRRDDAGLRHRVGGGQLHLQPRLVAALRRSRCAPSRGWCSAESS